MMNLEQLQALLNNMQALAQELSLEGRCLDASFVAGGVLAIRAQNTKLTPPSPPNVDPAQEAKPKKPTRKGAKGETP